MADDIILGPRLGANPFAGFGKGAGFGIKAKKATTVSALDVDTLPKKDIKIIKYSREFLMDFVEQHTKCPPELHHLGMPEIVIQGETERDQQREVLIRVAEDIGIEKEWRRADPVAPGSPAKPAATTQADAAKDQTKQTSQKPAAAVQPAAQANQQVVATQPAAAPPAAGVDPTKIKRAAESGQQAYKPGAQLSGEERALRTIKGVLNKLTPEKFERLLQQLLEVITTADILKQTITLVFENAVEQPTFCAMYADLCLRLSTELPSFPPPAGSDKAITFRQILLNTCQDEFEGTDAARENIVKAADAESREQAERLVKKRTMGNMRLISELYKQDMVKDWIMTACLEDLLQSKGKAPPEDNIEAACELITTAGARLAKSERADTRRKLDEVLKTLERLGTDTRNIPSRLRFVIKDVLDLKRSNWVPRREVFTAKKLDEVRAQAEAELGMISSNIASILPQLPTQQAMGTGRGTGNDLPLMPPLRAGGAEPEWGLFPPLRSNAQPAASSSGPASTSAATTGSGKAAAAAAPAAKGTAAQPVNAPAKGGALSEDDLKRKTTGLFDEYLSTLDKREALTCVRELQSKAWAPKLVEMGMETVLNSTKDKDQAALFELLLHLHAEGEVSSADIVTGLTTYTEQLEDLSMDYPKATEQLGQFVGQAVAAGAMQLTELSGLLQGDYGVEPKRDMAAATFKAYKAAKSEGELAEACRTASLHAAAFLTADPSLDSEAPSVQEWLQEQKLAGVVPE